MLSNTLLVATCLAVTVTANQAGRPLLQRQDQYRSFSNSSGLSSSRLASSSSSSSSEHTQFSYNPDVQSTAPSPLPSITSVYRTPSPPRPTIGASDSSISSLPPYPSSGTPSASPPSSYFPITASRIRPPVQQRCGGATINVRNASFDWWDPTTIGHAVSTLSFQHDSAGLQTGWTILPANEPFTLSSEFERYTCDESNPHIVTDTDSTYSWTMFDCSFVPITVAAATTATTVTAFRSPSATSGTGFDVPNIRPTKPADPSVTFAAVNSTFAPDSNFVYFSQYEIEKSDTTTYANGSGACFTTTVGYNLSEPYALTYTGQDPELALEPTAAITGNVDGSFLSYIGQANATAGSYTALPTVIVVVQEMFRATVVMYAAKTMMTATKLDTPTAVLPSGFSASATDNSDWASDLYTSLTMSARIESTAQILLVPPPSTTLDIPALSQVEGTSSSSSPAAGYAGVGQGNGNSGDAADANDVLSQALGSAIMQGIGVTDQPTRSRPVVNVAGTTASPTSVTAVVVNGQTAVAGGGAVTIGGTVISVASSGNTLVVGGSSTRIPAGSPATFVVDGTQMTATKAAAYGVAGQTLAAGGLPITVDGTKLSLASNGNAIVMGSSTLMLSPPSVITVASATVTADAAGRYVLGPGQTLTPGGQVILGGGTTVSLVPSGTAIVINGQTTTVGTATITPAPGLTIDGQVYSSSGAGYLISGHTLTAGGAITFTGSNGLQTVSLDRSGSIVVDVVSGKSTTSTLRALTPAITLGGQVFTAASGQGATYTIAGQTLTAGGVRTVTLGGTTYIVSLAATPTAVVIQTLGSDGRATATSTETLGAGSVITASAPNKSPAADNTAAATTAPATGQASTMVMEMLTALFGAAALAAAAFL